MGKLDSTVAVVYGGSGVVGAASALALARHGAIVHLVARTAPRLEALATEIRQAGGTVESAVVDATDPNQVKDHLAHVVETSGRLDIIVNAVGITHVQGPPLTQLTEQDFLHPVVEQLRALFTIVAAAAPHLRDHGGGCIITLSTPGARLPGAGFLGNGVASAAIEAFSRIAAGELGSFGTRVVCIRPNAIPESVGRSHTTSALTSMAAVAGASVEDWLDGLARHGTLLGVLPMAEDIGEVAAFLASPAARAITGTTVNMTAGTVLD